jgi:hypothetical protein
LQVQILVFDIYIEIIETFLVKSVLKDIHEKKMKWSWEFFRKRRDERKAYVEIWTDILAATSGIPYDDSGKPLFSDDVSEKNKQEMIFNVP